MQLKPGTKGIIVRPLPCCGYTGGIGKIVVYKGKCSYGFVRCTRCFVLETVHSSDVEVTINSVDQVIDSVRVKWFNDDLDLEDTVEEEVTKELENAAV